MRPLVTTDKVHDLFLTGSQLHTEQVFGIEYSDKPPRNATKEVTQPPPPALKIATTLRMSSTGLKTEKTDFPEEGRAYVAVSAS
jgi:hypothetical protein